MRRSEETEEREVAIIVLVVALRCVAGNDPTSGEGEENRSLRITNAINHSYTLDIPTWGGRWKKLKKGLGEGTNATSGSGNGWIPNQGVRFLLGIPLTKCQGVLFR